MDSLKYTCHLGLRKRKVATKMDCDVEGAYMNLRYRILNIGEERYILDMGGSSFWRILFPFLYWLLPVNVYKVNDDELIDKIVSPYIQQKSGIGLGLLGGIIALGLGGLLYPLVNFLDVEITPVTSSIIISIIVLLVISFYFYSNIRCGRKLQQDIQLDHYPKEKLRIRPESKKYCINLLYFYLLFMGLTVLFLGGSIQMPNGFMFFAGGLVLFLALGVSIVTIRVGKTTVRFKGNTKREE